MSPVNKLYLKTFIYTGVPFGIFMMLIDYTDGKELLVWKFVVSCIFFGIFMSAATVSYHIEKLKSLGIKSFTEENLSPTQSNIIRSNLKISELLSKLKVDPTFSKMKTTFTDNSIKIKSSISWASWGEHISIEPHRLNDHELEYKVTSKPKLNLLMVDYGINLANVRHIERVFYHKS